MLELITGAYKSELAFKQAVNDYIVTHPGTTVTSTHKTDNTYTAFLNVPDNSYQPVGMLNFAEEIIAIANDANLPISNLQLQATMYQTIKTLLQDPDNVDKVTKIYDEAFEVWRYGPMIRTIYDLYNIYGAEPLIENIKHNPYFESFDLPAIVEPILQENHLQLMEKFREEAFHQENQDKINGWRSRVTYPLAEIGKE